MSAKNSEAVFYPIPSGKNQLVSFNEPEVLHTSLRPSGATKKNLPEMERRRSIIRLSTGGINRARVAKLKLGKLCSAFADRSYVSLDSLKIVGLVPPDTTYLTVVAGGKLDRHLMVEANEFSKRATRMLALTGGRAIELY